MILNWKTIDKLEAKVPGAENSYKGELCEFDVKLGRSLTPLRLDLDYKERFRIENKTLDIAVEADSLEEAKKLLREKLAASDNFEGQWKLWVQISVHGGHEVAERYGEETADCSIRLSFYVELLTRSGRSIRKRHRHLPGKLPDPFTGKFPIPRTHKELARLQDGGVYDKRDSFRRDEIWVEATPELVETLRDLQRRLGESGAKVEEALSKKRFLQTLEAIRAGQGRLLLGSNILATKEEK